MHVSKAIEADCLFPATSVAVKEVKFKPTVSIYYEAMSTSTTDRTPLLSHDLSSKRLRKKPLFAAQHLFSKKSEFALRAFFFRFFGNLPG
jgi:hypothetical protein